MGEGAPLSACPIEQLRAKWQPDDDEWSQQRRDEFVARYGKRSPAAAATLRRDGERVPCAAPRLRASAPNRFTQVASAAAGIGTTRMTAVRTCRRRNAPEWLNDVEEGKQFVDGVLVRSTKINEVIGRLAA